MKRATQALAHRGSEAHQLVREFGERMTQTVAQTNPAKQRPPTLRRAVKTIDQRALDPVRRLVCQSGLLQLAVRRDEGCCTLGVAVAQMPDESATNDGGQIDPIREAFAVLFIGQNIRWQWQMTLEQHADQAVLA